MINILFPFKLYAHILQLEQYEIGRFLRWVFQNYFRRQLENKKPLVWTPKISLIVALSIVVSFLLAFFLALFTNDLFVGLFLLAFLLLQPFIPITFAAYIFKGVDVVARFLAIQNTKDKIAQLRKVKVIGVTGSYGKTSVKNILYYILRTKFSVLRTPESYNTVLGIARVVELELTDDFDFFICEMGAYHPGDIAVLCDMVQPNYAVLTGVTEQHLERFGSLEAILKTKWELPMHIKEQRRRGDTKAFSLINAENAYIAEKKHSEFSSYIIPYSFDGERYGVRSYKFDPGTLETSFELVLGGEVHPATTKLLGRGHLENILGAAACAHNIGLAPRFIIEAIKKMPQIKNRMEIKRLPSGMTIIDNAFSTNVLGFGNTINLVKELPYENTILVTPGIVELGKQTDSVHYKLGSEIAGVFTHTYLVGDSDRTRALAKSIPDKQLTKLAVLAELWPDIHEKGYDPQNTVVVFESDVPDNY